MKQVCVNPDTFDLDKFVNASLAFIERVGGEGTSRDNAMTVIVPVDADFRALYPKSDRNIVEELTHGMGLFFPYSTTNADGQPIMCADGRYFMLINSWERAEDLSYLYQASLEESDDYEEIELSGIGQLNRFPMGSDDYIGFMVRYDGEAYIIDTAVSTSSRTGLHYPTVSVREDCYIFDQPMAEYLLSFMTAGCDCSILPPVPTDDIIATDSSAEGRLSRSREVWVN